MTWIQTASGKHVDLIDPNPDTIDIVDIAHALSQSCRFNGHCRRFYSVAQHSVLVSRIVPPEYALEGLMHDAAEAYVGDMVSPLKDLITAFSFIEKRILKAIGRRFGFNAYLIASVKHADLVMLATERRDLLRGDKTPWPYLNGIEPLPEIIWPWDMSQARTNFLQRFHSLSRIET